MDEAAAGVREFMCQLIQQMVHQVVADIGAGCVGNSSRNAVVHHLFDHGFNRNGSKVSSRSVFVDGFALRSIALVVREAAWAVLAVDGNTLNVHRGATTSLSDQNHDVRVFTANDFMDGFAAFAEYNRDFFFDNLCAADFVRQQANSLKRRVHFFFTKWLETGNNNFHFAFSFSV